MRRNIIKNALSVVFLGAACYMFGNDYGYDSGFIDGRATGIDLGENRAAQFDACQRLNAYEEMISDKYASSPNDRELRGKAADAELALRSLCTQGYYTSTEGLVLRVNEITNGRYTFE